jgi:apolipoprotein N-acyltransferase
MRSKCSGSLPRRQSSVAVPVGEPGSVLERAQIPERVEMVLAAGAGAVLPLAFAPFDWFWIAPLSYAALFYLWRDARPGRAFGLGFVYGFASLLTGLYWIYISVHDFGLLPVPISLLMTLALPAVLALYIAAAGWIAARWFTTTGAWAWLGVLPALFVLCEWCRGWVATGFGWLSAGYSQTDSWLMGYAPVVGVYGMSWLVVLSSGALVAVIVGRMRQRLTALAALLIVFGSAFLLSTQRWTVPEEASLSVALVQGAVPQTLKYVPGQIPVMIERYRALTESTHGEQLVIWPEAAIPELYENVAKPLAAIAREIGARGSTLMLGILKEYPQTRSFQNAVITLTSPPNLYVKRHLVPFGEYYPVPEFMRGWLRLMNLPSTDAAPGMADPPPLALLGERIAVTICYEDLFGAEQRHYLPAATLFVNVSNDAWFGDSIAPHQHLQIARLRAAETGRYWLRATNTGISAVIDPRGNVVERLPQFEPGVLTAAVRGYTGLTPYARWGNWPVVLGALLVLALQLATTKLTMRPRT